MTRRLDVLELLGPVGRELLVERRDVGLIGEIDVGGMVGHCESEHGVDQTRDHPRDLARKHAGRVAVNPRWWLFVDEGAVRPFEIHDHVAQAHIGLVREGPGVEHHQRAGIGRANGLARRQVVAELGGSAGGLVEVDIGDAVPVSVVADLLFDIGERHGGVRGGDIAEQSDPLGLCASDHLEILGVGAGARPARRVDDDG